jgi:hypothetical protein
MDSSIPLRTRPRYAISWAAWAYPEKSPRSAVSVTAASGLIPRSAIKDLNHRPNRTGLRGSRLPSMSEVNRFVMAQ